MFIQKKDDVYKRIEVPKNLHALVIQTVQFEIRRNIFMRKHAKKYGFRDRLPPSVLYYVFHVKNEMEDYDSPPTHLSELEDFLLVNTDVSRTHLINLHPNGELRLLLGIDGNLKPRSHYPSYIPFAFFICKLRTLEEENTKYAKDILSNLHPTNKHLLIERGDGLGYLGMARTGMYYLPPFINNWTLNDDAIFNITNHKLLRYLQEPDIISMAEANNRFGITHDEYHNFFFNKDNTKRAITIEQLEGAKVVLDAMKYKGL